MSGVSKRVAVSMKAKLKALERLKKQSKSHTHNYGRRIRCGRANSERCEGGRNLKSPEGCCIQRVAQTSNSAPSCRILNGKFRSVHQTRCLCRKDKTKVQKKNRCAKVLALHQKINNAKINKQKFFKKIRNATASNVDTGEIRCFRCVRRILDSSFY